MAGETKNRSAEMLRELTDEDLGTIWMNTADASQVERQAERFIEQAEAEPALADDGPAKVWTDVPNGAVLQLQVGSQNPSAAAIARFASLGGTVELWPHQAISPGPKSRPLAAADRSYTLNVIVAFDQDHPGKVAILARAIHQGTIIKTYFHVVSGTRGEIKLGRVLIGMV